MTLNQPVASSDKCWIFVHLQKSGGSTIKGILKGAFREKYVIYDSVQWTRGNEFLETFVHSLVAKNAWDVIAGGYPEALRRSSLVDQKCQFFTMFRHPIPRMVSAYYYCHKSYRDKLCAWMIVNANEVDLITFAKHWSNFAVRQFALSLVPADDVMQYSQSKEAKDCLPSNIKDRRKLPGWYLLKIYLEDQARMSRYVEIPDAAMYAMLQPVKDLIRAKYTVGILEEFNTTLSLFDAALGMPGIDWHKNYVHQGAQNVDDKYAKEEAAALAEAWTNVELKKYMKLDIMLYEYAVDVFHQQARARGLD